MTLALEVLKNTRECDAVSHAIKTLEEAIAKQEQRKPVAFITNHRQRMNVEIKPEAFVYMPTTTDWEVPLYTTPQQRKPLTDEQIYDMYNEPRSDAEMLAFARAIEAAHGIKENT